MRGKVIAVVVAALLAGSLDAAQAGKIMDMERMRSVASGGAKGEEQRSGISDIDRSFGFSSTASSQQQGFRAGTVTAILARAFYAGRTDDFDHASAVLAAEIEATKAPAAFGDCFRSIRKSLASGQHDSVESGLYRLLNELPDKKQDPAYAFALTVGFYLELINGELEAGGAVDTARLDLSVQGLDAALAACPAGISGGKFAQAVRALVTYCRRQPVTGKNAGGVRNRIRIIKESV